MRPSKISAFFIAAWVIVSGICIELFKHAIYGWAVDKIEARVGLSEEQVIAFATGSSYAIPLIGVAGILIILYVFAFRHGRSSAQASMDNGDGVEEEHGASEVAYNGLTPLHIAVMWAYERLRKLPRYQTYIADYERKPARLPSLAAQLVFNNAEPRIPIAGVYPPRTIVSEVEPEHAQTWRFSDDARELFDPIDPQRRYTDLRVLMADIERRVRALGG